MGDLQARRSSQGAVDFAALFAGLSTAYLVMTASSTTRHSRRAFSGSDAQKPVGAFEAACHGAVATAFERSDEVPQVRPLLQHGSQANAGASSPDTG